MTAGYNIVMDTQQNTSLGMCWTFKLEDQYGEVYETMICPMSDYTGCEALDRFVEGYAIPYLYNDNDFEAFYISTREDEVKAYIDRINAYGFSPEYAVEYRDMHTALHHLWIFASEEAAENVFEAIEKAEALDYSNIEHMLEDVLEDVEIDYRDVDLDETTGIRSWDNCGMLDHGVIIVNTVGAVPDIYA